jgi:hypothetical protein
LNNETDSDNICYFYPGMKDLVILLAFALLPGLTGETRAQEPNLSYRLRPGERYYLKSDLQQSTHSESIDSEEISFYSLTGIEFHVDSMDRSGNFFLRGHYQDLLISMLAPHLDIDINSASGKDRMLSEMVNLLEQGSFQLVMTPRGELLSITGLDGLFAPLEAYPASDTTEQEVILKSLEETYGADALRSLFNLFVWVYPVLNPMTNWTNDVTYYFNTKSVSMVNRYLLSRTTEASVGIQGIGMLNSTKDFFETTGLGDVKSSVTGSQTFDFQMNPENGWLKRCVSRQRVIIETTILKSSSLPQGLRIPSYTETVFEVSGGRLNP